MINHNLDIIFEINHVQANMSFSYMIFTNILHLCFLQWLHLVDGQMRDVTKTRIVVLNLVSEHTKGHTKGVPKVKSTNHATQIICVKMDYSVEGNINVARHIGEFVTRMMNVAVRNTFVLSIRDLHISGAFFLAV